MAISTFDGFIASSKQYVQLTKIGVRTSVAASWTSVIDMVGNPGAGVLAGTSTTTGVVPTDATAGMPLIDAFGGGATGYLAQVTFGSTLAGRLKIFDLLWKGGAYAFNVATSGNSPTSFSSRIPGGTNYGDTQIWYEQVTAGTLVQNVNVNYNNQSGTAKTTGVTAAPAAMIVGRMFQIPLASGDTGVQGITGVTGTVASAGTFNLLVMRPIWTGRITAVNAGDVHDLAKTGMPIIYADSALSLVICSDTTSTGIVDLEMVVANG